MIPIWDMLLAGVVALPDYAFIIYILIYIGKFLIAVVSFPVALRMSAELFKQVLKYKNIVKIYRDDDDSAQYEAYFAHFKIIYCLLLSLIVYITFTIVCSVNGTYMLGLFHELGKYSNKFPLRTVIFFLTNSQTGLLQHIHYISIPTNNYVMYCIEAFRGLGENGIMLFAAILIYQIVCYIQKYNFSFWFWFKIFAIRAVFVLFSKSNIVFWIINTITNRFFVYRITSEIIYSLFLPFPLLRKIFELFENTILTVMSFVLLRVAFKTIKLKERENRDNQLMIEEVGQGHIIKVGIAIQLFKIFTAGYFFTTLVNLGTNMLECHFIYLLAPLIVKYTINSFTETQVSIGIIVGLLSFLPTLLYILFLWKLWFYIGNLRNNPYRYRREDFIAVPTSNVQELNNPHFDKLRNQDRIILAHHLVITSIASLLIAGFCSQFLHIKWAAPLTLKPGDYILMNDTHPDLLCDGELEYSFTYSPTTYLDPVVYKNSIDLKNETCWESIHFYSKPIESYFFEQNIKITNASEIRYVELWSPAGTYFHNISKSIETLELDFYPSPKPCYIFTANLFTLLPDKLCFEYQNKTQNGLSITYINETICNENKSRCITENFGVSDISMTVLPNSSESIELHLKRRVYRGGNSSILCDFRNISDCDAGNIQLIVYRPEDLYYSKSHPRESICQFSAVCYYNTWIPIISSVCIFLLTLLCGIGTIILIHIKLG